jgi:hypothetical protein
MQIYATMLKFPNIRAAQIAELLHTDIPSVSRALRPLVEVGDVVQVKGSDLLGNACLIYSLSEDFKKSKDYDAAMATAGMPAVSAERAPPAAAASQQGPVLATTPVFIPPNQPRASKAQLGIEYVSKHSPVKEADLAKAMGLAKGQYASAYLTVAISNGHIHKEGGVWKTGPAPKAGVMTSLFKTKADPAPAAQPARAVTADPTAVPGAAIFRCGLWSDGVLELQRDGSTVAVLEQAEGEQLVSFVNRMLVNPLGTAVQTSTQG